MTDQEILDYEDKKWISKSEWKRIKKSMKSMKTFMEWSNWTWNCDCGMKYSAYTTYCHWCNRENGSDWKWELIK